MTYPIDGNPKIYQGFTLGKIKNGHVGIDYEVPVGTPVRAVRDGIAIWVVQDSKTYGRFIAILHTDGYVSYYAHLSKTLISKNEFVSEGTVIGLTGGAVGADGSGKTTGPHLHFEIRVPEHHDHNWFNIDPIEYLDRFSNS